jgi:hypothetical protein
MTYALIGQILVYEAPDGSAQVDVRLFPLNTLSKNTHHAE